MTQAIIMRADARNLPFPDGSIDLIITSPPYWSLRSYTDGGEHYDGQIGSEPTPKLYIASLIDCTREWMRVLKPSGSIFVNMGDKYAGSGGHNNSAISNKSTLRGNGHVGGGPKIKTTRRSAPDRYMQETGGIPKKSLMGLPWRYAIECIDTLGLILRAEIIWAKPNGLPESVKDRVARKHEQWFHLVKSPQYYANLDPIRKPHAPKSLTHRGGGKAWGNERNPDNNWAEPGERKVDKRGVLPGSVWQITSEPFRAPAHIEVEHFAVFPSEWPKRLIQGWCPAGGVVLDPLGGAGTVALAAQELGRVGITNDMSADYCRLAQWRTTDPGQIAKMRKRIERKSA